MKRSTRITIIIAAIVLVVAGTLYYFYQRDDFPGPLRVDIDESQLNETSNNQLQEQQEENAVNTRQPTEEGGVD